MSSGKQKKATSSASTKSRPVRQRSRSREGKDDEASIPTSVDLRLQQVSALHSQLKLESNELEKVIIGAEKELEALQAAIKQATVFLTVTKEVYEQKEEERKKVEEKMNVLRLARMEKMMPVNSENSRKIDRDSLYCVFSYLDFNDWKESRIWLVCHSWYRALKKSRPLKVACDLHASPRVSSKFRRDFLASPFIHHFTRLLVNVEPDLTLPLLSSLIEIEELTITKMPLGCDLSPLLMLPKLSALNIWPDCFTAQLNIIKQLPALTMFRRGYSQLQHRQSFTESEVRTLTTQPTNIEQWHLLDLSGEFDRCPNAIDLVLKFTSLRCLHFSYQPDPCGKLAQLKYLQELTIDPQYDLNGTSSLHGAYNAVVKQVSKLILILEDYFQNLIRRIEMRQEHVVFQPHRDEATKQLKDLVVDID